MKKMTVRLSDEDYELLVKTATKLNISGNALLVQSMRETAAATPDELELPSVKTLRQRQRENYLAKAAPAHPPATVKHLRTNSRET